jgi:hypothetical protein
MIAKGSLLLLPGVTGAGCCRHGCFPVLDRRLQVTSRLSTFAAVAAAVLLAPALAIAQAPIKAAPNALPPGLGSGTPSAESAPVGRLDGGPAANKPAFKELRLDNQSGALNSFVRVGPSTNGQGQGSAESRSTGSGSSGTSNPNERRSPELFKLGGNVKF